MTTDKNLSMTPDNDKAPQRRKRPRKDVYKRQVGIGAAVLLGGLIAEISSFDDAFILGLIMLFFSAVLYMKVIGPQYEKNKLR